MLLAGSRYGIDLSPEVLVAHLALAFACEVLLDGQVEFSFPEFQSAGVLDRGNSGKRGSTQPASTLRAAAASFLRPAGDLASR